MFHVEHRVFERHPICSVRTRLSAFWEGKTAKLSGAVDAALGPLEENVPRGTSAKLKNVPRGTSESLRAPRYSLIGAEELSRAGGVARRRAPRGENVPRGTSAKLKNVPRGTSRWTKNQLAHRELKAPMPHISL